MKIKTRRYYIYYLLKIAFFVISLVPLKVGLFIADKLGKAGFKLLGKHRDIALANLDAVFSDDHAANKKIAEGVFSNLVKNGAEWIKLFTISPKKVDTMITGFEGREHLDDAVADGKGAVVLGFHFGNWELLGIGLKFYGYPGKLVGRRIYFHKYDDLIVQLRNRFGAKTIYRDESPREMLRELKKGTPLGIVPDQDVDSINGVFVDFFGKKAFTPTAPVKLAMAAKVKIVPIFVIRQEDNTHKFVAEEPIDLSAGNTGVEDVKKYTQKWTSVLERMVRKYPDQWVWIHSRWKTKEPLAGDTMVQSEV